MIRALLCILALCSGLATFGQTKHSGCDCPKNPFTSQKTDTAFLLSNGRIISLCGYRNPDRQPVNFSEFALAVCGQDTILGFWPAVETCRLKIVRDTLLIEHLKDFPTGPRFAFQEAVWMWEQLYFVGETVFRKQKINRQVKKYRPGEIQAVLKAYETADSNLHDTTVIVADQLFVAALSGSSKARHFFKTFETKFGPLSGDDAEEYHGLVTMLRQWDSGQ